ncbi:sigma-54-dependent Fis family transcriptional regulator [Acidobacteria bacterium AB60]|nr:sigma-54-dependent Fis family transcriptional regulator [Acidobacteria bacterium AB60]
MTHSRHRTALLASADSSFRQRLRFTLTGLRWQVREVESGAEAWAAAESGAPEAVIVDSWLPDLELSEFLREFCRSFPSVDVIDAAGTAAGEGPRSIHRQELLYALRSIQGEDAAAWGGLPDEGAVSADREERKPPASVGLAEAAVPDERSASSPGPLLVSAERQAGGGSGEPGLTELVGNAACMLDVSRRIRLVAPRNTPVLIEGPTGSGKELVAEALHRLSPRNRKPFIAINCAAIPEALLEAELFGHTRGAFTGAVHGRVGRIEAADGGTLFLDEIGEMPPALQSKLLRFVECGELQRVGDNDTLRVDVRIVAATHRQLGRRAQEGTFRSDLYYRLAVFLIRTPSLMDHMEDLPLLVGHFLQKMGRNEPVKRLDQGAMAKLRQHGWPGNVRELEHVLERAAILTGSANTITAQEIDFGLVLN